MVNEEVNDLFASETGNPNDVIKELFGDKAPKTKTDLSSEQISIIARLYMLAKIADMPKLKVILDEFIVLRISKERKSRAEFVTAFQSADAANKQSGMFSNIVRAFSGSK